VYKGCLGGSSALHPVLYHAFSSTQDGDGCKYDHSQEPPLAASVAITLILQGAVSVQRHRIDLVVLRVLGLSGGLLRFSLAVELALVSFLGILVGSVTGLLLAIWSLGRVDITSGGLAAVPPLVVTFQPWLMFTIFAVLFATSALAILVTSLLANRLQTFEVLRLGQ